MRRLPQRWRACRCLGTGIGPQPHRRSSGRARSGAVRARRRPHPVHGDTAEYTVLIAGRPAGALRQWPDSGGTISTAYSVSERGRGPVLRQTLRVDKSGLPTGMMLSGTNDLRRPVRESVQPTGPQQLTWRNDNAAGRVAPGRSFYLPLETIPTDIAALARAAQLSRTRTVTLLPEGTTVTIAGSDVRTVSAAGRTMRVTRITLSGLAISPQPVWLDDQGRLFASGDGRSMVIRSGFEPAVGELVEAQRAATLARDGAVARRLTRRPAGPVAIIHANLFDATTRRMSPARPSWCVARPSRPSAPTGPSASPPAPR